MAAASSWWLTSRPSQPGSSFMFAAAAPLPFALLSRGHRSSWRRGPRGASPVAPGTSAAHGPEGREEKGAASCFEPSPARAASLALSNRKEIATPHLGVVNSLQGEVYPVEPYESLSMNQVLDAHWGILDDEDVVVWFSTGYITIKDMVVTGMPIKIVGVAALKVVVWFNTGYITIKDMVVTGMPIKIVGVAALTVLLPTLDIVKEKEVPKRDGSNKFDSKEVNLK
ncbi:hypothetical protein ZWY2020_021740 [Hordeum vulgare]|nr:hypothetical protein ZWY2020_021740 [Hordeum vulgare]